MRHAAVAFSRRDRVRLMGAATIVLFAGLFAVSSSAGMRAPLSSAETRFVETTTSGLQIVPASCPSSPHSEPSECDQTLPTLDPGEGCNITATPSTITIGQASVLEWTSETDFEDPFTRTISPDVGPVAWSGTYSVAPTANTTYTLTGTRDSGGNFQCSVTVNVTGDYTQGGYYAQGSYEGCAVGYYCTGDDLYYRNSLCQDQYIQACTYGCVGTMPNGQCALPPGPQFVPFTAISPPTAQPANTPFQATGELIARPIIVREGETTQLYWNATNVTGCTVTGSNGDSWNLEFSGASGQTSSALIEETTFTLDCTGVGGQPLTDTVKVNVIPIVIEL